MENYKITKLSDLDKTYIDKTVKLFVDGFHNVITISEDKEILRQLFRSAIIPHMFYVCLHDEEVIGLLGYGNNEKRAVYFNKEICKKIFGEFKGSVICWQMNMIMGRPVVKGDTEGYIDFLTTHVNYRGKGIATQLIAYICKDMNYESYSLEVLSTNVNAKRLYENLGFETEKINKNIFVRLGGLGSLIEMKKIYK